MFDEAIIESWLHAAGLGPAAAELERVYADAAAAIAARGPACWASGRCCNFDQAGHRLYVTGLEAAYCLVRVVSSPWAEAGKQVRAGRPAVAVTINGRAIELGPAPTGEGVIADIDAARARGGCPFQVANLCGVHAVKPLGCRVYFCDRTAETWQQELSERLLRDIRDIHDRHRLPYRYGEWRDMLDQFRAR